MPDNEIPLEDTAGFVEAYRVVDARIKEWTEMRESLRNRILESLGDAEIGTIHGKPAVRYARYSQRRISTVLLVKKYGKDDLADCYVETQQRRFNLLDKVESSSGPELMLP